MKTPSKKMVSEKPTSPELAALPPEFREMTLSQMLKHFGRPDAPKPPKSVLPWLDAARQESRARTLQEILAIYRKMGTLIDRLLDEAV